MTESTKKNTNQRVFENWLYQKYPTVFSLKKPIPLAIGVGKELLKQLPDNVTPAEFKVAMNWYCLRMAYQKAILKHSQRINLQGELVGEVQERDKQLAQERLDKIQQKDSESKPSVKTTAKSTSIEVTEPMQPIEEIKSTKLTLKRKSTESVAKVTTVKIGTASAPAKITDGNIATAKGLKITMVIEPNSIPNVDSIGMKKVALTINVANTDIQVTVDLSAKSYRKALSTIEEYGVDGCNAILQGSMKQYGIVEDGGLVIQPKKTANADSEKSE